MTLRLTLTLPPGFGSEEVEVDTKRFSIGRTPENDLVIDDSSLSRRHAIIENLDGIFRLSDCGSSNGTLINGRPVTTLAELCDWDVLTFGGVGDIVVRLQEDAQPAPAGFQRASANATAKASAGYSPGALPQRAPARHQRTAGSAQTWFSGPVIAAAAALVIVLVAGLILLATSGSNSNGKPKPNLRQQETPNDNDDGNNNDSNNDNNKLTSSPAPSESVPEPSGEPADLSIIEAYASKVLIGISKDQNPVVTAKPRSEINAQVQRYKGSSSVRDELQALKRAMPQVSAAAKSNGVRPPLLAYSTLARIDKDGGRGDPAQVAAQLSPALAKMRVLFGDELANDALLSVAALEEGPGLQMRITKLSGRVPDSVTTIRSIWYLHDHQVISSDTYDFVLRFLALGVIAQDPQKFGIKAEPLTF